MTRRFVWVRAFVVVVLAVAGAVACGGDSTEGGGSDVAGGSDTGAPGLPGTDGGGTPSPGDTAKPDGTAPRADVPGGPDVGTPGDVAEPPICDPSACDPAACLACDDSGACVSVCVVPLETCDGAGSCVAVAPCDLCDEAACEVCGATPGGPGCVTTCNANDCEDCDGAGSCRSRCDGESEACDGAGNCRTVVDPCADCDEAACEVCGATPDGAACVGACNPNACELCDGAGGCASRCDAATETCDGAGGCVAMVDPCAGCDEMACEVCGDTPDGRGCVGVCDARGCEVCDGAGGCLSACAPGESCAAGVCREILECTEANPGGYCDASVITSLTVVEGCCCDFTGDGSPDNGLADVIGSLGGFLGMSLDDLNALLAENVSMGAMLLLAEYVGLAPGAADTPSFDINFYVGEDTNDDPLDNFSGDAEIYAIRESMTPEGDALVTFLGASVLAGVLTAGPSGFVVPVQDAALGLDLIIAIEETSVSAQITSGALGYQLGNGQICGLVMESDLIKMLNDFVGASCGCLNLDGPFLVTGAFGGWACSPTPAAFCSTFDEMENLCATLAQFCGLIVPMLPALLDVDLDGDNSGDAVSVGGTFTGTSVRIVGEPAR